MMYILDDNGEPAPCADSLAWARWFEDPKRRRVASAEVGPWTVSTVFLGIDHAFGGGAPPPLRNDGLRYRDVVDRHGRLPGPLRHAHGSSSGPRAGGQFGHRSAGGAVVTPLVTWRDRVTLLRRGLLAPFAIVCAGIELDMPPELLVISLFGGLVVSGVDALRRFHAELDRRAAHQRFDIDLDQRLRRLRHSLPSTTTEAP